MSTSERSLFWAVLVELFIGASYVAYRAPALAATGHEWLALAFAFDAGALLWIAVEFCDTCDELDVALRAVRSR